MTSFFLGWTVPLKPQLTVWFLQVSLRGKNLPLNLKCIVIIINIDWYEHLAISLPAQYKYITRSTSPAVTYAPVWLTLSNVPLHETRGPNGPSLPSAEPEEPPGWCELLWRFLWRPWRPFQPNSKTSFRLYWHLNESNSDYAYMQ